MPVLKKHNKQWIITAKKNNYLDRLPSLFDCILLQNGMFLYYEKNLSILHEEKDGKTCLILGFITGSTNYFTNILSRVGRFVTIIGNFLSLDATGSMGVFYSTNKNSEIIATSSIALVSEITDLMIKGRDLKCSKLNWDPLPYCRITGMKKLMLGQKLDLEKRETISIRQTIGKVQSKEESTKLLKNELIKTAKTFQDINRPLYLAMTGGLDSRTVFAALIAADTPFRAFTMELEDKRSQIDGYLASKLCKKYGIEHEIVKKGVENLDNARIYKEHSGGVSGDRGIQYAIGDYYRNIPDNAVVLHGGCFEIGQKYYENLFENIDTANCELFISGMREVFNNLGKHEIDALIEWYNFRDKNPIRGVDWSDLFYLDQRRAGWGSANRQEEDVFGFDWCIFVNSWKFVDMFLTIPEELKKEGEIQKQVISSIDARMLNLKINPPVNLKAKAIKLVKSSDTFYQFLRRVKNSLKRKFN